MRKMRISVVKSKLKCLVYIKEYQVWGKVLGNPEVMIFQKFKVSGRKVEAFIHSIWKVYFMSVADFSSRIFRVAVKSGCSRPCHCILSVPSSSCHLTALVFFFFQYPHHPLTPQRLQGKPAPLCSGMERVARAKPIPPWQQQLAQAGGCDPGLLGSS